MDFTRGHVTESMHTTRDVPADAHGTRVHFVPDPDIFQETTIYDIKTLTTRVRELAFLNKGLRIVIRDERPEVPTEEDFMYEGGIKHYVEYLDKDKNVLLKEPIYVEGIENGITVEVALQYTDDYHSNLMTFTNNIHTYEGGTHEEGFKRALTRIVNDYARKNKLMKDSDPNLSGGRRSRRDDGGSFYQASGSSI